MKTSKRNKLLGLALTGSFSLFSATNVLAAAGDPIANTATLGYDVGGAAQTVIESSAAGNSTPGVGAGTATSFVEDRVINFTVVRGGATGVAVPGGLLQSVQYTLTNNGNGDQGFLLKGLNNLDGTADPFLGTADEFDATLVQTFVENTTAAVPGYDPTDTEAFVATLAVGASVDVYVVSTIPLVDSGSNPLVNTNVGVMTLVAQAAINNTLAGAAVDAIMADDNGNASTGGNGFTNGAADLTPLVVPGATVADDPATEQVVFNDAAAVTQDGAGNADTAQNAQHSDNSSYTIATAALTVTKSVPLLQGALWDPINNAVSPKSIPGAYVTYTVTIANTGAANADLTTLTDTLAAALDLDPDFVTNAGPGTPTGNPLGGDSFRLTHSNGTANFCTGDVADGDADGCSYTGAAGGAISVNINTVMGGAPNATLANGESLTIEFNVIIQ